MKNHWQDEKLNITFVSFETRMDYLNIMQTIAMSISTRVPISTCNSIEQRQNQQAQYEFINKNAYRHSSWVK
jgi:hypothetical protein